MQHVKPKWLRNYVYATLLVDILLFAGFFILNATSAPEATIDFWGITPLVLVISGAHIFVTLFVYPFIRKTSEWAAFVAAMVPYGLMLSAVIETSGNVNVVYRILFIVLVFFLNMVGPFLSISAAVVAWILLIFDFLNLGNPIPEVRALNIIIDVIVSIAAISGWLFFRRYYMRDKATVELASMLEQEQFKSSIILESITDGVLVINTEGSTQIINVSAAAMFGWTKEEAKHLQYNSLYTIMHDDKDAKNANEDDVIALTLQTGKAHQKVIQVQTKHNKHIFVDTVASPIYQETSNPNTAAETKKLVGVIAVFRDVDKQKREEQQRADFISTASHEMRTPVAAIEGYLALAMNDKVSKIDDKAKAYLEKAHTSTQHLGQLFQDLLTSAKADDGRLSNHPTVTEMGELLEHLAEDLKFSAEKKGLVLEFIIGAEGEGVSARTSKVIRPLYYAFVDPDRISEVVTNLFDNAVKYTPSGKVSIGITGDQSIVQFYIKDTGAGIPNEDIPHLFQKFYRVDNSATRTIGGTGLGLFICRKIVELYGGRIWVESEFGKGTTFFVNLPRLETQKADYLKQQGAKSSTTPKPQV